MKRFKHPDAPGRIVEADEARAVYLLSAGWVEVDKPAPAKKAPAKKAAAAK